MKEKIKKWLLIRNTLKELSIIKYIQAIETI